ncbi:MAG: hypothetical protein OEX17_02720 [Rhodospirillaceae bacterium]|nr:hypothetical protein [Rhodospirillaceae bacterium]
MNKFAYNRIMIFLALCALVVFGDGAIAQETEKQKSETGNSVAGLFGDSDSSPIEVNADQGIEWQQDASVFIARGNATATRGTTVVRADELRAYYRNSQNKTDVNASSGMSNSEIWRLDAIGSVTITGEGWQASGGHSIYDVSAGVMILKDGSPITLVSGDDVITATKQMEFWNGKKMAIARGNATATKGERKISADVLSAHLKSGAGGKDSVDRIEAFDNVKIITPDSTASAKRAAYSPPTGLARLDGAVTIQKGENKLVGCSADFDLNTAISRLKSCPGGDGKAGRVKGILLPGASSGAAK